MAKRCRIDLGREEASFRLKDRLERIRRELGSPNNVVLLNFALDAVDPRPQERRNVTVSMSKDRPPVVLVDAQTQCSGVSFESVPTKSVAAVDKETQWQCTIPKNSGVISPLVSHANPPSRQIQLTCGANSQCLSSVGHCETNVDAVVRHTLSVYAEDYLHSLCIDRSSSNCLKVQSELHKPCLEFAHKSSDSETFSVNSHVSSPAVPPPIKVARLSEPKCLTDSTRAVLLDHLRRPNSTAATSEGHPNSATPIEDDSDISACRNLPQTSTPEIEKAVHRRKSRPRYRGASASWSTHTKPTHVSSS